MSNRPPIQRKIESTFSQLLPETLVTRRRALVQMITGLHLAKHVRLSKVTGRIAGTAQLKSKTRHLRRFLGNENVDPERFYSPVRDRLIEWAAQGAETQGSGPIRLLVDAVGFPESGRCLWPGLLITGEPFRSAGKRTDEKESRTLNSRYPCSKHLWASFSTKQRLWS